MRAELRQRSSFKSQLLIGAAGLVTASPALAESAAPPPEPVKWQAFSEIGAGGDDVSGIGSISFFAPLKQDNNSLLFARFGVQTRLQSDNIESLTLGYRVRNSNGWILGGYAGFDRTQTELGNSFTQISIGAEAMSEDWDAHINAYGGPQRAFSIPNHFRLDIHDTYIGIQQQQEAALAGFDGEVGYRVFHGDTTDVRLYAGGYNFQVHDTTAFPTRSMAGPKGGAQLDVYDLDFIGGQSRFELTGEIRHDDLRGTTGFVGASLRIPLGDRSGAGVQALDELDRRMVDNLRRNNAVATSAQYNKSEPVIIYGHGITSQPTNTLLYVDNNTGEGTLADPTTLPDATTRPGPNQFIVLTDKGGSTVHTGGATVGAGETLVGGGQTFNVRGADSGVTISHTFAPGTGPISLDNPGGAPVLTLGSDATLSGFSISTDTGPAIYGHNVHDILISDVTLDGNGTAGDGIVIKQDAAGDAHVTLKDLTITGFTGDGVNVDVTNAAGLATAFDLQVSDSSVATGGNGVIVTSATTGGSASTVDVGIHNSTLAGGITPLSVTGSTDATSTLNQTVVVDPTILMGGNYGILINATSSGGAINQNINIDDVTITDAKAGVKIAATGTGGASITQNIEISNLNVTDASTSAATGPESPVGFFLDVDESAASGSHVAQTLDVTNLTGDVAYDGIMLSASAQDTGSHVYQTGSLDDIAITGIYALGLSVREHVSLGAAATQTLSFDQVSAIGNYHLDFPMFAKTGGVFISAAGYGGGNAIQRVDLTNLTSRGNGGRGLGIFASGTTDAVIDPTVVAQYVNVSNATVADNDVNVVLGTSSRGTNVDVRQDVSIVRSDISDLYGSLVVGYQGAGQQNIKLNHDTMTGGGARLATFASYGGFAEQNATIYHSDLSGTAGSGLTVYGLAFDGGSAEQHVAAYYDNLSHSGSDNVSIKAVATGYQYPTGAEGYAYYSHVEQNIHIGDSDLSSSGGNGVRVLDNADGYAQLNQYVYIYNDDVTHNARNGVAVDSTSAPGSSLYTSVGVYNSNVSDNALAGITATSHAYGNANGFGAYMIEAFTVSGSTVNHNGTDGFVDNANAAGIYSFNQQTVTLAGSQFDDNRNGAVIADTQTYGYASFGAVIQNVTIQGSAFDNNTQNGLVASAAATDIQGRAEQHFTVLYSQFDNNGANGMMFTHSASGGDYRNDLPCTYAQGLYGGCAFVRQSFIGYGLDVSHNGNDGIDIANTADNYGAIYALSGRPLYPTFYLGLSNISDNGRDGLHIENSVTNSSYQYEYVLAVDSHFDNNAGYGVFDHSDVGSYSVLVQGVTLAATGPGATTADGNGLGGVKITDHAGSYSVILSNLQSVGAEFDNSTSGAGISVVATADEAGLILQEVALGGGSASGNDVGAHIYAGTAGGQITQVVGAYGTIFDGNRLAGLEVAVNADSGVTYLGQVAQYVAVQYAAVTNNGGYGGILASIGAYDGAVARQDIGVADSVVQGNTRGVTAITTAQGFGSTQQNITLLDDTITHNTGDGVRLGAVALTDGFAAQNLTIASDSLGTSTVSHNGGNGLSISGESIYGGNVEQYTHLIGTDFSHNGLNGVSMSATAYGYVFGPAGYIYYSHVQQYMAAYYDRFDHNGAAGFRETNYAGYTGQIDSTLVLVGGTASRNGTDGIVMNTTAEAYSGVTGYAYQTNVTANAYIIAMTANGNAGNGINIQSSDDGPSYLIQHITISDSHADNNGGSGLLDVSLGSNVYTANIQYLTLAYSTFNRNGNDGATLTAYDTYGPASFGVSLQQVTVAGSTFNGNARDGLYGSLLATGNQGRAEQYFTIQGSTFNNNTNDGLYFSNTSTGGVLVGTQTCDTAQGTTGGCAIIRQHVTLAGSSVDHNGGDGIYIKNVAQDYGSIYAQSGRPKYQLPTLLILGSDISHNGGDGIAIDNTVDDNSYLFQYTYISDSTVGHNGGSGLTTQSYVGGGSVLLQQVTLYSYSAPTTFNGNGANGIAVSTHVGDAASYAYSGLLTIGIEASHNTGSGIVFDNTSDAGGASIGVLTSVASYFIGNGGDGISMTSTGTGAAQYAYINYNGFSKNTYGIAASALSGGQSYIDHHYGNVHSHQVAQYHFYADSSSVLTTRSH